MLYREIIAVCSQIHTKHINTLCGQNVELLNVKLAVHIVTTGLQSLQVTLVKEESLCRSRPVAASKYGGTKIMLKYQRLCQLNIFFFLRLLNLTMARKLVRLPHCYKDYGQT